ncbi:MAG: coenzyme F420-0:L-glutamate ligase/coenzyme F420-1:gamma-L-glutamate ligase [Halieaceae bacterium]|jgi:coenzyme F420-0:L-glutamate ligase/coenzyme F420-1:gamma-L-glutamate ligase
MAGMQLLPLGEFPLVNPGDDLARLIADGLTQNKIAAQHGDVIAIAQKVVSKAEDRYVALTSVTPGAEAIRLAGLVDKDPRLIELILAESSEVVRSRPGVIIVRHKLGYVHANAGIDRSNIQQTEEEQVLLLPENPDASAVALRSRLLELLGVDLHVLINDSAGRAWRNGTVGMTIGSSGFAVLKDQIGESDLLGNTLEVTVTAVADELAAAASFVMGQGAEATPVVVIRGAKLGASPSGSSELIRERDLDLFR